MNRKKQKENFNDLLIRILLVLCVMPFIIHLAEYSCGYSKYLWYAENDTIQDLYCYYRSYFFEVIAVITLAVLVFRMGLYKENRKPWRLFMQILPPELWKSLIMIICCSGYRPGLSVLRGC